IWLRLRTHDVPAGTYPLTLELSAAKLAPQTITVQVVVHPVQLPRRRMITLAPGGTVYGDVNKTAEAVRFSRNLEAHGSEWAIANTLRANLLTVNDEPLSEKRTASAVLFTSPRR